ncbi:hypothetical protein [Bacillus mojavensis]|uniref:hypothetical protein n=1 Tax=Bacillus mojavensis TaxID=72360 RepID=UPI00227F034D|nr:hypothetical protein [Bacillus mojavensis]MCY8103432.1 hypothetical protein [Bacillus mojavensis]MCY8481400.1 hypothetical protein [Bacillus mojavensis]
MSEEYLGFIHNNEFYEIVVNKNPSKFLENLYAKVARLPLALDYSENEDQNIVIISYEKNSNGVKPVIKNKSGTLPKETIEILLEHSKENPGSFLPSSIGGSVNYRD